MKIKNKKKVNILPCPFCNSKSELLEVDQGQFMVRCLACDASTDWYSGTEAEREACKAWNKRKWALRYIMLMAFYDLVALFIFATLLKIFGYVGNII